MEYSDLNNYLKGLEIKQGTEPETYDRKNENRTDIKLKSESYVTVDRLQRDLTLFNDMNNSYNAINAEKIESEFQTRENYKNNDMNSRLGERGLMPGSSVFSGRNGPLQNVVLDMTPLSTRLISKDKNKNKN